MRLHSRSRIFLWAAVCAFTEATPAAAARLNAGALVLVNSTAPDYPDFQKRLEPYLIQFGIPYAVQDISAKPPGADAGNCSVIIIGHRGLDPPRRFLTPEAEQAILTAVKGGAGLVSFDGLLASWSRNRAAPLYQYSEEIFGLGYTRSAKAGSIVIGAESGHFITDLRAAPRTVQLKQPMLVPGLTPGARTRVLARSGELPLLLTAEYGEGRAVLFAADDWASPEVKGKLYGLDDLVWRSLVWAARKPFLMRGMPRFLALRVDDVSGFGIDANRHLGWVLTANRYGLIPWLGVFLDDMREDLEATGRLSDLTRQGLATASVHARRWSSFFYLEEPLRTDEAQRNILGKQLPGAVLAANFKEAGEFFARNRIAATNLVLPHFYESQPNIYAELKKRGVEFVGTVLRPGDGYGAPVPASAPYLSEEPPRASDASDPIYIADWLRIPGHPEFDRQFFNFVVEIRDVTGYEWAPSRVPIEEAIRRGVEETRREFDSLVPGVLFTHESDHIQHIPPADWDRILKGVIDQLEPEQPVKTTLDRVCRYLRALRTSRIRSVIWDPEAHEGTLDLEGTADAPTKYYVWRAGPAGLVAEEHEAAAFRNRATGKWR